MDYCYGKNPLNMAVDPTHCGQLAAGLDFCYSVLHMYHTEYGDAT